MNLPSFLQSSVDPSRVSLSVESFGKTLVGLVALIATIKGLDQQTVTTQFQAVIDQAATGAAAVFTVYHSIMTIYGLVRKGFMWLFAKPTPPAGS